jgi:epidermal growth factor receptor substrate 15
MDQLYNSWFDLADVDRDGALSGQEAVQFFLRSDLPQQTLKRVRARAHSHSRHVTRYCDGAAAACWARMFSLTPVCSPACPQIWELSDSNETGQLDRPAFKLAMQMVSIAQQGAMLRDDHPSKLRSGGLPPPPPPTLRGLPPAAPPPGGQPGGQYGAPSQQPYGAPQGVAPPVPMHSAPPVSTPYGAPPPPAPVPPTHAAWPPLTPDDARRHAASFRTWDTDGDGKVTGAEAKPLFAQSGVATVQWFKLIWDLADGDVDGSLTLPEFVVASYFLEQAAKGRAPPAAVPPGIFPPPHALMAAAGGGGGVQAPPPSTAPSMGMGMGQMQPQEVPRAPQVAPSSNIPVVPALPDHLLGAAPASDAAAARAAHSEATKAQAALVAADGQRVSAANAAAELTAVVRDLTLLKRRCEAELSEAEYGAERATRQLAEARTAHEAQRSATEAVQARLAAAHAARQQAEAEMAELQAQNPGGADVQAAVQLAESQQLAAQQALMQMRDAAAVMERATAARMDAERQLGEAQAAHADKGHALAQEEARLRELQQQLALLRSSAAGDGGHAQAQQLGDVAQRAAQLAGEALALARAQGVAVTLPPQLLAALPPGSGAPQAAVFTDDWREWEDFPDAGWVAIGPHAQANPQAQAAMYSVQPPAVPPPLPPQRASFDRPVLVAPQPPPLQPPPPKPQDLLFGGLGSPNGAFGASAPPAMAPPPPPPRPLDDDFFGSGFGSAPPPPSPPAARQQDLWSSFM